MRFNINIHQLQYLKTPTTSNLLLYFVSDKDRCWQAAEDGGKEEDPVDFSVP
jgi:hypothetical protein